MPSLADVTGLWRRSSIRWPDGRSDQTTWVRWMQGPSLYADLRQPAGRPSFEQAPCLRALSRAQLDWLARQDGFAGEVHREGEHIEWQRSIDLQPPSALPDAGRLRFEGEVMIEEGLHAPYVETWHRDAHAPRVCGALLLREAHSGRCGIIVRVGELFMYARARSVPLPSGQNLPQGLAQCTTLEDAQDLIDCEVSLGRIESAGWRIRHSSLPFKEGHVLTASGLTPFTAEAAGQVLRTADLAADGAPIERQWTIVRLQGNPTQPVADAP